MSITDQIHNYYEHKVVEALNQIAVPKGYEGDQLVDLACIALNNLPTRYFRHEVDIAFYMSAHEHEDIDIRTKQAVNDAIKILDERRRQP